QDDPCGRGQPLTHSRDPGEAVPMNEQLGTTLGRSAAVVTLSPDTTGARNAGVPPEARLSNMRRSTSRFCILRETCSRTVRTNAVQVSVTRLPTRSYIDREGGLDGAAASRGVVVGSAPKGLMTALPYRPCQKR